jgi:hypothetical protein
MENSSGGTSGSAGTQDTGDLIKEQVSQTTQRAANQAQQVAGQVTETAKSQAQSMLASQKQTVADDLSHISQALHSTSDQLQSQNLAPVAGVVDTAAQRIDDVSGYLRNADLDQMLQDAENVARRNQMLFLGGTFALGLLAARFLKSSAPRPSYGTTRTGSYGRPGSFGGYDSGSYNSGAYAGSGGYAPGYQSSSAYATGTDYGSGPTAGGAGYGSYAPTEDVVVTGTSMDEVSYADGPVDGFDTTDTDYADALDTGAIDGTINESR